MNTKELSSDVDRAVSENTWLRLALIFFVVPLFLLLLIRWLGEQVMLGWLLFTGAYAAALLIPAFTKKRDASGNSRTLGATRNFLSMLSPIVLGGLVAVIYFFLYMLTFDRENFFPR